LDVLPGRCLDGQRLRAQRLKDRAGQAIPQSSSPASHGTSDN